MNLPNKLTMIRIICTPIFYIIFLIIHSLAESQLKWISFIALSLFWLILEITDILDGYLARKLKLVTDLGKIMDPFADVLIRFTFFSCFVIAKIYPFWPLPIIFWRELCMTSMRYILSQSGIIIPANWAGKSKTVLYFITSAYGVLFMLIKSRSFIHTTSLLSTLYCIAQYLFIMTMIISILSSLPYFIQLIRNKDINNFIRDKYLKKM